jgi:hypothetical protein
MLTPIGKPSTNLLQEYITCCGENQAASTYLFIHLCAANETAHEENKKSKIKSQNDRAKVKIQTLSDREARFHRLDGWLHF